MIRCPVCRALVDSTDLRRHLHTHTTVALLRVVWRLDWRWTLLTLLLYGAAVVGTATWLWLVVWP